MISPDQPPSFLHPGRWQSHRLRWEGHRSAVAVEMCVEMAWKPGEMVDITIEAIESIDNDS